MVRWAPFVKTLQGGRWKESKADDLLPERNTRLSVIPQIISNNAEDFLALANHFRSLGYREVNLNLGCPVPQAAGRGRGAGLLAEPRHLIPLLEGIFSKLQMEISIKTRIGYYSRRIFSN